MVKGLYTAYTGLVNQQHRLDVLTNNLANSATNGFKKEGTTTTTFGDTLALKIKDTSEYFGVKRLGEITPGVEIGENYTDFGQGPFRVTDNVYDVALDGDGFFAISFTNKAGETSVKYTRDGAFTVNTNGYLVTKDGGRAGGFEEKAAAAKAAGARLILIRRPRESGLDYEDVLQQCREMMGCG